MNDPSNATAAGRLQSARDFWQAKERESAKLLGTEVEELWDALTRESMQERPESKPELVKKLEQELDAGLSALALTLTQNPMEAARLQYAFKTCGHHPLMRQYYPAAATIYRTKNLLARLR